MGDTITVFVAQGAVLAKRISSLTPEGIQAYDKALFYNAFEKPVDGLISLARKLLTLAKAPNACIVRGALLSEERRTIRRLSHARDGYEPTLGNAPRRWLAVDMDSVGYPPGVVAADLVGCGRAARAVLPPAFHDARCLIQATAGHGIKPTIRLRLWFWLDRALADFEAKRWLAKSPADASLYSPSQPCYTATPLFLNGLADHLPRRLSWLPGEPVVRVPPPEALAAPPRRPDILPRFTCVEAAAPYVRSELTAAISMIRRAQHGERHTTIVRVAAQTARLVHGGWLAESAWRSALLAAVADVAPDADPTNITAALDWALATVPTPGEEFDRDVH